MGTKNDLIQLVQLAIQSETLFQSALALTGVVNRPQDYENLSDTFKRQNFDRKCHDLLLKRENEAFGSFIKEQEFLSRFGSPFVAFSELKRALKNKSVRETFIQVVANRWGEAVTQNGAIYRRKEVIVRADDEKQRSQAQRRPAHERGM